MITLNAVPAESAIPPAGKAEKLLRISSDVPDSTEQDAGYVYDKEAGQFSNVQHTSKDVDNLLWIGTENKNSDPEKAAHAVLQALDLAEVLQYESGIAKAYNSLGSVYHLLGDYEYALQQFHIALGLETGSENRKQAGRVLKNIAMVHMDQKNYDPAAVYFKKAVERTTEADAVEVKATALSNLGLAYYHMEDYEQSLDYYARAIEVAEAVGDLDLKMLFLANAGNTYIKLDQYELAESYLQQALSYFNQKGFARQDSETSIYLGTLYLNWGRYDEALARARYGLQLAGSTANLSLIRDAHRLLSEIYEAKQDYSRSLASYKDYFSAHDSLLNLERQMRISQRQIRFDIDHRNRQIILLNEKNDLQEARLANQELWHRLLLIGLVFFILIAGLLYRYIHVKKQAGLRQHQQSEEIEQQNRQLVQLNREKDEFLGMAAHDLRNPVSNISTVVYLMEQDGREKDEDTLEYIQMIRSSIDNMMNLIDNFLNVKALEEGLNGHRINSIDVSKVMKQVVDSFQKAARDKKIYLTANRDPDMKSVLADEDYLHRILNNLLSNAIKFSPSGSAVEVSSRADAEHVEISVKDNGPGITKKDQEKMFQRFARLSNKPTGNESSTGLGLFTVKKLTELMGGEIRCESKPGKGTVFTIVLPVTGRPDSPPVNHGAVRH
ncbi:MAG: tetratricopeptide repeat-containing sensor histidine kinase [Balneolaceae bacterium]